MSASQVTVIGLIAAAFALGWWGHGWRQGARSTSRPDAAELDAALRSTITAFQAALGVWQAQRASPTSPTPLAGQALAAFERDRAALEALALDSGASPDARAALERARRAAGRLSEGLAPLAAGEPLELGCERSLLGAERALTAARHALLAASVSLR
jgi:hypothetical protein